MRLAILKLSLVVGTMLAVGATTVLTADQPDQQPRGHAKGKVVTTKAVTPGQVPMIRKFHVTAFEGKIAPNTLRVKKGEKVRITFVSRDGTYGIKFKDFDVKDKVSPDKPAVVDLEPGQTGTFEFRCSRTWSVKHWSHNGTLVVE